MLATLRSLFLPASTPSQTTPRNTPELVEKDAAGRLIGKIMALEVILKEPGEMITQELRIFSMTLIHNFSIAD